jgi:hypothetical protein
LTIAQRGEGTGITKVGCRRATSHAFPNALLSVSDASTFLTPPLNRIAQVSTINRALRSDSCCPVLFGYCVTNIEEEARPFADDESLACGDGALLVPIRYTLTLSNGKGEPPIRISARCIFDARGLGDAHFPAVLVEFEPLNPMYSSQQPAPIELKHVAAEQKAAFIDRASHLQLTETDAGRQASLIRQFPTIMHALDFHKYCAVLAHPLRPFVGQRVAVVGCGDSGKTICEFLLRHVRTEGAYAYDSMNAGSPDSIFWVGQRATSASEFERIGSAGGTRVRERYRRLGRHLDHDELTPVAGRVDQMVCVHRACEKGKQSENYLPLIRLHIGGTGSGSAAMIEVDYVIFATGFTFDLCPLATLIGGAACPKEEVRKLFAEHVVRIPRSEIESCRREAASVPFQDLGCVPSKKLRGHNIFFVGAAGGDDFEGVGDASTLGVDSRIWQRATKIRENRVTVFALGSITQATATCVSRALQKDFASPSCRTARGAVLRWIVHGSEHAGKEVVVKAQLPHDPAHFALRAVLGKVCGDGTDVVAELVKMRLVALLHGSQMQGHPGRVGGDSGGQCAAQWQLFAAGSAIELHVTMLAEGCHVLDDVGRQTLTTRVQEDMVLLLLLQRLGREGRHVRAHTVLVVQEAREWVVDGWACVQSVQAAVCVDEPGAPPWSFGNYAWSAATTKQSEKMITPQNAKPRQAQILMLCGPHVAGKSTIMKRLLDVYPDNLVKVIKHTCRTRRVKEVDGTDKHFITLEQYAARAARGDFLYDHQWPAELAERFDIPAANAALLPPASYSRAAVEAVLRPRGGRSAEGSQAADGGASPTIAVVDVHANEARAWMEGTDGGAWLVRTLVVGIVPPSEAALHERTRTKFRQGKRKGDQELTMRIQSAEMALMTEHGGPSWLDMVVCNATASDIDGAVVKIGVAMGL